MIKTDHKMLEALTLKAKESRRKRINHNYHQDASDTLQRMLNCIEPESYSRPHKHENPDKREAFIILEGSLLVIEYDDNGNVIDHIILNHEKGNYCAEIKIKSWHNIIALESGTTVYELKDGPYDLASDKIFAPWAPDEFEPNANRFNTQVLKTLDLA